MRSLFVVFSNASAYYWGRKKKVLVVRSSRASENSEFYTSCLEGAGRKDVMMEANGGRASPVCLFKGALYAFTSCQP